MLRFTAYWGYLFVLSGFGQGFGSLWLNVSQRRNSDGPRQQASDRVFLSRPGRALEGWALNASRGGVRVVLEEPVRVGEVFDVRLGESSEARAGRIVWVRDEADGQIAGVQFVGASQPPETPSDPAPKE